MVRCNLRIFELPADGSPEPLDAPHPAIPKPTRHLIARRLSVFFGAEHITSDLKIRSDQSIDVVGLVEGTGPIIVQFKTRGGENVVETGFEKLAWLFDHPTVIRHQISTNGRFSSEIAERSSNQPLWLYCIAGCFNEQEIELAHSLASANEPVRLIRCVRIDDDHLILQDLDVQPDINAESQRFERYITRAEPDSGDAKEAIDAYSDHLNDQIEAVVRRELANQLKTSSSQSEVNSQDHIRSLIRDELARQGGVDPVQAKPDVPGWLEGVDQDLPRSTRFLMGLRNFANHDRREPIEPIPGKTTLRQRDDDIAPGAEFVYGVKKYECRVECYIPNNWETRETIAGIKQHWRYIAKQIPEAQWEETPQAVRVLWKIADLGWDDPEYVWFGVYDDLIDAHYHLWEVMEILTDDILEQGIVDY